MKTKLYIITILLSIAYIHPTYAQENASPLAFSAKQKQPIEITADDSIEWLKEDSKYIATGNAIAIQGESSIQSDILIALYNPEKGQTAITTLMATGNVILTNGTRTIKGDTATYDMITGELTVTGNTVSLTTPIQSITATKSLQYFDDEQKAIAIGNVVADDGTNKLKTDRLIAHFTQQNGETTLSTAETYGRTHIITLTEVASGDSGYYDAQTQTATLKGNVKITRGDNQLNGNEATVDMKTGISQISSTPTASGQPKQRVRALFVPEQDK